MKKPISVEHKKQLEEIRRNLNLLGARESNFIKVELLFYDSLSLAREYGDDVDANGLLAALKQLQLNEYQQTKALFNKSAQREQVIRRFISSLKNVLTAGIRNSFYQSQLN
jgi:hypothetical protein